MTGSADLGDAGGGEGGPVGSLLEAVGGLEAARSAPGAIQTDWPRREGPAGGRGADSDVEDDESDGEVVEETFIEHPSMPAVDPHEIEDAEDLLESYFIQVDYLLRRLLTINERIDDVEDLVEVSLDHRRNELVATDLMVTTITAGFAWVAMIAGIFGMNLLEYSKSTSFFVVVMMIGTVPGCLIVLGIVAWVRHRRLMFIPNLP